MAKFLVKYSVVKINGQVISILIHRGVSLFLSDALLTVVNNLKTLYWIRT